MRILKNPTLQKAVDFFRPLPEEATCLGVALGRDQIGVIETREIKGKIHMLNFEAHTLPLSLWPGDPKPEFLLPLVSVLAPLFKERRGYCTLQVSLPDAASLWEVFELEKIPTPGPALDQFLNWRLDLNGPEKASFAFSTQSLGEENGKNLLLAVALKKPWMAFIQRALDEAGASASFLDVACHFRFNFFHEIFLSKGPGALVSLEMEYWSLLIWDGQARPRFQRSKWWRERTADSEEPPLAELVLEVERTIRSYVHSGPDRSVENLHLLAPPAWMDRALEAFRKPTEGRVSGLEFEKSFEFGGSVPPFLSPSLAAVGVRQ